MNKPAGNLFAPETLVDPFDYYREAHEAGVKLEFVAEANAWVVLRRGFTSGRLCSS